MSGLEASLVLIGCTIGVIALLIALAGAGVFALNRLIYGRSYRNTGNSALRRRPG